MPVLTPSIPVGKGDGAQTLFSRNLVPPVTAGTLAVIGVGVSGTDNGIGNITGTGIASGTIDYATGAISVTLSSPPALGIYVTASYSLTVSLQRGLSPTIVESRSDMGKVLYELVATGDGLLTHFEHTCARIPIIIGATVLQMSDTAGNGKSLPLGKDVVSTGFLQDTREVLPLAVGSTVGTIDYVTGDVVLDLPFTPASGQKIYISYAGEQNTGYVQFPWTGLNNVRCFDGTNGAECTMYGGSGDGKTLSENGDVKYDWASEYIAGRGYKLTVPDGATVVSVRWIAKGNIKQGTIWCPCYAAIGNWGVFKDNAFHVGMGSCCFFEPRVGNCYPWQGEWLNAPDCVTEGTFASNDDYTSDELYRWGSVSSSPGIYLPSSNATHDYSTWRTRTIAGGALGSRNYYVASSSVSNQGEGTMTGASGTIPVAANKLLVVNPPGQHSEAIGWYPWVGTTPGNLTKQSATMLQPWESWTEPTTGLIAGDAPTIVDDSQLDWTPAEIRSDGFGFGVNGLNDCASAGVNISSPFAGTLTDIPILPGSVRIAYWYGNQFTGPGQNTYGFDDGAGNIVGTDISGTIDYATGVYAFTLTQTPTSGLVDLNYVLDSPAIVSVNQMIVEVYYTEPGNPGTTTEIDAGCNVALCHLQGWVERGNINLLVSGSIRTIPIVEASYPLSNVYVYNTGTLTLATLYDETGAEVSNPRTATADGRWDFYVSVGRYDVRFTGGTPTVPFTYALGDVCCACEG